LSVVVLLGLSCPAICVFSPLDLGDRHNEVNSCGVAALAVICKHYKLGTSLNDVRQECELSVEGVSIKNLVEAAHRLGLQATPYQASMTFVRRKGGLGIVDYPRGHFCVFLGWKSGQVMLFDPPNGVVEVSPGEFEKGWGKHIVVFSVEK